MRLSAIRSPCLDGATPSRHGPARSSDVRAPVPVLRKRGTTMPDAIFQPLQFKNLTVKNRVFRSNIAGRLDNYDGSGNQARINWEVKFAKGGVGAIVSSFVPVLIRGRIMPNYATNDEMMAP